MFTIRFRTQTYRPNLTVTMRTNVDGWAEDIPGIYENDEWRFELPEEVYQAGFQFKFRLERLYWMGGDNLYQKPVAGGDYVYDETVVRFPKPTELLVENSSIQQYFFQPILDENRVYDVLVIGSGIGGGILADQLADRGADVLVLEAGSYLFPTHVGNLPRRHIVGQFDKNIWGLYEYFKIINYVNANGSYFGGGQAFNLGGRSIFWGGLIPRMQWWETDTWPQAIKWYLEDSGYQHAEDLLRRISQPATPYQQSTKRLLRDLLPDYNHFDAPVAVQSTDPNTNAVPVGVFSTADLLLEARLTGSKEERKVPTINLNHAVNKIEADGKTVTQVQAYDLIAEKTRTYKAKYVALAAGTIESAKIAQLSRLNDPNEKIGKGMTDHTILYTHFYIPGNSPSYSALSSSKTLSQYKNVGDALKHPYNMVLELGTDFNQGRFLDPAILEQHNRDKGNTVLCEIVFLFYTPLLEQNYVQQYDQNAAARPVVSIQPANIPADQWNEVNGIKNAVIEKLGGAPFAGVDLNLQTAGLGGVAHEVGTLRIGDHDDGVVDTNLKFLAYDNLFACDLSVFPMSPAANPTLTLTALAIRLADHLKGIL
jgi:choline dehydrogenase-like flavoprotein